MRRVASAPLFIRGETGHSWRSGVGGEKVREHPTHPTTRRPPMRFNGLRAVGRRQVRQMEPIGCSIRRPDGVCLCERTVREAFGMLARGVIGMTALGPTSDVDRPLGYACEDVSVCLRTARTCHSRITGEWQERRNSRRSNTVIAHRLSFNSRPS